MKLRVFTRRKAHAVRPGDTLEAPKPFYVEEVTQLLGNGVRLTGKSPTSSKRSTIEMQADEDVELPVPEALINVNKLLGRAFTALAAQVKDDETKPTDPDWFTWGDVPGGFLVEVAGQSFFLVEEPPKSGAQVPEPPVSTAVSAVQGDVTVKAKAAAKKAT